ncbi:MAG: cysteine desulfurase NifS [Oscillospiraceae bacterium]|jgi:cysteine desulfurase|nr:cysteine desulfurase NifS [Oscillospiraceae bacterium]
MKKSIYCDNAATTKISDLVLSSMMPFLKEEFGNASSLYKKGRNAKRAIELSREKISNILNTSHPREIFFTSGGSESDNWAIKGICNLMKTKNKKHIITSAFEHHAVLHTVQKFERDGFEVTYLDVHRDGLVRVDELEKAIRDDTALVTIMYANNEIGTIQPIEEIGKICRKNKVLFHTDAVQAAKSIRFDLKNRDIDLLSLSAHKINGPKGIGLLYIKQNIEIENLIEGGTQERNKRAGTENVANIVGFSVALEECQKNIEEKNKKVEALRERFLQKALKIDKTILNGSREKRLPGNVNMCFNGIEGEALLLRLDNVGIAASSGSACTSGSLEPSHVLLSLGLTHEVAHGSLRLTFSEDNTEEDVDYILEHLVRVVSELREMSPIWS